MSVLSPILAPENSFTLTRGANKTLQLTVTNPDSTATNLTGCKLILSVKSDQYNDLPIVQKLSTVPSQGAITKPREGLAEFYFVPSDTQGLTPKTYIYDVWLVTTAGDQFPVVQTSNLVLLAGVTYLPK
jgi:hypothetical protein